MIQLIHKQVNAAWQHINPYLPSKEQLKLAAKVTTASVGAFGAIQVGCYYYYFSIPWQVPFEKVFILDTAHRIFRKISEEGISFLKPSNFNKVIRECSLFYCYFYPKIDPWYVLLRNNFFNLY